MKIELIKSDEILREDFSNLKNRVDVANLLEVSDKTLIYLLYRNKDNNYKEFCLNKKSGGQRIINAPASTLKILQRKLNYILALVYSPKPSTQGFCLKRGIVSNARIHIRGKKIFNIDIKDFFPSINFGRVRGLFMAKPYDLPAEASTVLAQICCHNNCLPQGAPTSPIVSNMICARIDGELQRLAKKHGCIYTRYADDITFSTTRANFSEIIARFYFLEGKLNAEVGEALNSIITSNGFEINENKVRMRSQYTRQEVTGLTVNEKPNIRRKFIRQLRAMLHAWEKHGLDAAEKEHYKKYNYKQRDMDRQPKFSRIVEGKIGFVKMVRGEKDVIYRKLVNKFNELMNNGIPELPLTIHDEIKSSVWIIKSGVRQGTAFMLKDCGLVTCAHVINPGQGIEVFRWQDWALPSSRSASIVLIDKEIDLAVLKINGIDEDKFPCFDRGDSSLIGSGNSVTVAGFRAYKSGEEPLIYDTKVAGFRGVGKSEFRIRRIILDNFMTHGESGGPALNKNNEVIGVVVTGAEKQSVADQTEEYAVIPISALDYLKK